VCLCVCVGECVCVCAHVCACVCVCVCVCASHTIFLLSPQGAMSHPKPRVWIVVDAGNLCAPVPYHVDPEKTLARLMKAWRRRCIRRKYGPGTKLAIKWRNIHLENWRVRIHTATHLAKQPTPTQVFDAHMLQRKFQRVCHVLEEAQPEPLPKGWEMVVLASDAELKEALEQREARVQLRDKGYCNCWTHKCKSCVCVTLKRPCGVRCHGKNSVEKIGEDGLASLAGVCRCKRLPAL
jgi:hypothetical protein